MAEDKKISDLTLKTELDGSERLVVASGGDNYGVKTGVLKSYAQQGMVAQETGKGLSANDFTDEAKQKLEKLPSNEQFGNIGFYSFDRGMYIASASYHTSGMLPLNRNYDLVYRVSAGGTASSLVFFAADGTALTTFQDSSREVIVAKDDYPDGATYFAISTTAVSVGRSYYRNGETVESQMNAVAMGLTAKLDNEKWNKEHEQFEVKGYFLYKTTGMLAPSQNSNTATTALLPLNRNEPIILTAIKAINSAVALWFYDAVGKPISYPNGIENLIGDYTVSPDEFPENACFFRVCTEVTGSSYSNGTTFESRENAVADAIQASKIALFVDQWNMVCAQNGKYDPANAPDAQHPFYLNTLWLTYEEALKIIGQYQSWGTASVDTVWNSCRTNIPRSVSSSASYSNSYVNLEVANLSGIIPRSLNSCIYGPSLSKVLIFNATYLLQTTSVFNAPNLEVLDIRNLRIDLDLSKCPLINLASWQGLVLTAANTSPITVTVHPNVYAKLTSGDAAAEALLPENLANGTQDDEWTAITIAQYETLVCPITNIADIGLRPGGNVTVAIDAKSLSGRRLKLYVAVNSATGERLGDFYSSDFIAAGSDGRLLLNFVMPQQAKEMSVYISNVENTTNIAPQREEYKGLKISIGKHPELPYTEPFSKIEDEALREKAEWLSLMQIAEARQINFVTTE